MKETFLKDIQTEEIEKDKETEKSNRKLCNCCKSLKSQKHYASSSSHHK
jgi:hypothetical protein